MSTDRAIVKVDKENGIGWRYFRGKIQCMLCGWQNWLEPDIDIARAIELYKTHFCQLGDDKNEHK